jgi:hypothetical protein
MLSFKKLSKKAKDYGFLLIESIDENGKIYTLTNKTFDRDTRNFNTLEEVEIELDIISENDRFAE